MLSEYDKAWCNKLLTDLGKMPITSPFKLPVDPVREAPNYLEIVKHPMDFSTMKKKLQGNEYPTVQSFIDDIQLICDNAKTFNGETSIFGLICDDIMDEVNKQYSEKADNADEEWYKSLNKAIMLMNDHINSPPPEVAAIQKDTPFPSIQDLENEQISKIESIIGGESIETLEKRWYLLSDHARRSIIDVIENRDDDEGENSNNSNDDE